MFALVMAMKNQRNEKYDRYFELSSSLINMNFTGKTWEVGFHSKSVMPLGLLLAFIRSDMEADMEAALPILKELFDINKEHFPGQNIFYNPPYRCWQTENEGIIYSDELWDTIQIPYCWDTAKSPSTVYVETIIGFVTSLTKEERLVMCLDEELKI